MARRLLIRRTPHRHRISGGIGRKYGDLYYPSGVTIIIDDMQHKFYDVNDIINAMKKIDVGPYVSELFDCEDRAKWVLAQVRSNPHNSRFWGAPMGEARGTIAGTSEKHALIVLWKNPTTRIYYDPARKQLVPFHPEEIIA
ncbi:MAG: hypothetical protein ACXQT4_04925 [Methanotrichaceae archaeon]